MKHGTYKQSLADIISTFSSEFLRAEPLIAAKFQVWKA